jgi:translation initiation factor 4A
MISRNENKSTPSTEGFPDEDSQIVKSFDDMMLPTEVLKGIYRYGWEQPTSIQERVVIPMKDGRDIVAQAQSGKGKTGAFAISSLCIVDCREQHTQVVILSPTRELAAQTFQVVKKLGEDLEGLHVALCVGGTHVRECIDTLRRGPQIVVGTPGRVRHMCERGELRTRQLRCIVLDEADEMLDRGFREAMVEIFEYCPESVQVCLFSATYTPDVLEIANQACRNPFRILVKKEDVTLSGIKQFFVDCEKDYYKLDVLSDLYTCLSITQLIIFVNSRRRVEELHAAMTAQDHTCSSIHGGMTTEERDLRMKEFQTGTSRVLISTDLLARGIDVSNVGTVINYDLPHNDFSNYIHRIGRSGRHGKKGLALNFVTDSDRDTTTIRELERYYCTRIEELPADIASIED